LGAEQKKWPARADETGGHRRTAKSWKEKQPSFEEGRQQSGQLHPKAVFVVKARLGKEKKVEQQPSLQIQSRGVSRNINRTKKELETW